MNIFDIFDESNLMESNYKNNIIKKIINNLNRIFQHYIIIKLFKDPRITHLYKSTYYLQILALIFGLSILTTKISTFLLITICNTKSLPYNKK